MTDSYSGLGNEYNYNKFSNATSAEVNFVISNDATWNDAIQFGPLPNGLAWNFPTGATFLMDVVRNRFDATPLLSMTTGNGRIVTIDPIQLIIQFNVAIADIRANLPPGNYPYTFIMDDPVTTPHQRTQLMHGEIQVGQGPTYP